MSSLHRHIIITSAPFLCAATMIWGIAGTCLAKNPQIPTLMGVSTAFVGSPEAFVARANMSDYPPRPEDYTDPEEYVEAVLRWIYRHTGSKASELDNHTLSQQIAMVAARVAIGGVFDLQTGEDLQNLAVVSKDLAFFDNPEVPLLLRLQINALGLEIANVLDK